MVADTGHNVEGIRSAVAQLRTIKFEKLRMVVGLTADKDIRGILMQLPKEGLYYFTQASVPRALKVEDFRERAAAYELTGNAFTTVEEALRAAMQEAEADDLIFVGGSTYVVGEALKALNIPN